jgi:hypothetical protein
LSDRLQRGAGPAFALAVLAPALLTGLVFLLARPGPGGPGRAATGFLNAFAITRLATGLGAFLIGLPLTRLLAGRRLERPFTYPLAGFLLGGAAAAAIVVALASLPVPLRDLPGAALYGALPGALSGAIWWFCHRRHAQ